MKKTNILQRVIALGLALGMIVLAGAEARAEYINRAGKEVINFGPGIDLFPRTGGLSGVKYLGPIMAPSSYSSKEPFTVAKLASVWARILELDPSPGAPVPKDVKKGKWYYGAFEKLSKTHILDYLVDKDGNINPNRQLYIYEIHRSIKYYWDYSGFSEILKMDSEEMLKKQIGKGLMRKKFDQGGADRLARRAADFHKRYKGRIWYDDVAQVVDVGLGHALDNMFVYTRAVQKATNKDAMMIFSIITGRTEWFSAQGYNNDVKIKPGHKLWTDFEKSALQSCPHGFIN